MRAGSPDELVSDQPTSPGLSALQFLRVVARSRSFRWRPDVQLPHRHLLSAGPPGYRATSATSRPDLSAHADAALRTGRPSMRGCDVHLPCYCHTAMLRLISSQMSIIDCMYVVCSNENEGMRYGRPTRRMATIWRHRLGLTKRFRIYVRISLVRRALGYSSSQPDSYRHTSRTRSAQGGRDNIG